jgi:cbb3-type cytochrome oxidase subunit 3
VVGGAELLTLLIIVLLGISIAVGKRNRKTAAAIDFVVALLLLFFRVIPGTGDALDTIFMVLFFIGSIVFFFAPEEA